MRRFTLLVKIMQRWRCLPGLWLEEWVELIFFLLYCHQRLNCHCQQLLISYQPKSSVFLFVSRQQKVAVLPSVLSPFSPMEYLSGSIIICCASRALCRQKSTACRATSTDVWDKEKVAGSSTFYSNPSSVKVGKQVILRNYLHTDIVSKTYRSFCNRMFCHLDFCN